jgi:hypothetical protein
LGDYQCKQDPSVKTKRYAYRFWDGEENTFKLIEGPQWLTIDAKTGILSGKPSTDDVGTATVKLEVSHQFGGRAEQQFGLTVTKQ